MTFSWRKIGKSVRGASHQRKGKIQQDAWGWSDGDDYLIVAIADGHGSDKSPYSRVGAEIGVNVAVNQLLRFWKQVKANPFGNIKRVAEETLPKSILRQWREGVLRDYRKRWNKNEDDDIFTLYGSTLLAVLVTEKFAVQLQLGDGDIVNFYHSGFHDELIRVFELSEECFGTETESLCQMDAERRFNLAYESLEGGDLGLIFLTTDGYSDSFTPYNAFFKAIKDFWGYLSEEGPELIEANLESWLKETSRDGSGDDITVALIYNQDFVQGVK